MKTFGINGFGRIGRTSFRVWWQKQRDNSQLKMINTSGSMELEDWVYLLKYDSNYGVFSPSISYNKLQSKADITDENPVLGTITLGNQEITVTAQRDPAKIPWKKYGVEVVIESTGAFTTTEKASLHFQGGAHSVIISAPPKGGGIQTTVIGVNSLVKSETSTSTDSATPEPTKLGLHTYLSRVKNKHGGQRTATQSSTATEATNTTQNLISNASCTTNSVAPVAQILHQVFGVQKAMLTTIHSYTDDQNLHDNSHKDLRRARAAALNIVPTSTGAAISVTEVIPELKGLFDGLAVRVPTPVGSLSDMVFLLKKKVTKEEINQAFLAASQEPRWQGILAVTTDPIVSSDIKGRSESAIIDLSLTNVVDGDLVKVVSWYDNEWGYCNRLLEQILQLA